MSLLLLFNGAQVASQGGVLATAAPKSSKAWPTVIYPQSVPPIANDDEALAFLFALI